MLLPLSYRPEKPTAQSYMQLGKPGAREKQASFHHKRFGIPPLQPYALKQDCIKQNDPDDEAKAQL